MPEEDGKVDERVMEKLAFAFAIQFTGENHTKVLEFAEDLGVKDHGHDPQSNPLMMLWEKGVPRAVIEVGTWIIRDGKLIELAVPLIVEEA